MSATYIFQIPYGVTTLRRQLKRAFTLVELLVVIAIIAFLAGLGLTAIAALQDSGNVTSAVYSLAGILENARAYAIANNTYTWVGFYEQSSSASVATSTSPINQQPPYVAPNVGYLYVAVVAAIDGSKNITRVDPSSGATVTNLLAVQKLVKIQNIHVTNLNVNWVPAASSTLTQTLAGRPLADDCLDDENASIVSPYAFSMFNYTFYKTLSFSPRGEAEMDVTTPGVLQHLIEVGLLPTYGGVINAQTKNIVALQISGLSGNVKIYRP